VNVPPDFAALGVAIGHATDQAGGTGCTVIRGIDAPMRCSAAIIGRATGTREIDAISPAHLVDRVDAVLLTGGSAYGLDAAGGVMRWMEERGRGFAVPGGIVPIVPAAVLFDLVPCGRFDARPTAAMAWDACENATSSAIAEGSVGAGTGATVGKAAGRDFAMKGGVGLGMASAGPYTCGAVAAVNALGDVRDAAGQVIAGARRADGSFADATTLLRRTDPSSFGAAGATNTTIACVMVNATLDRVALQQLSRAASAALARRITPSGTTFDGDVVFAVCPVGAAGAAGVSAPHLALELLAVDALEQAIERAVRTARGRDGIPGLADT
jgi:L-aminopeptidase/D-esterase-like protein